jgi:Uma2 family endonuclease
MTLAKKFDRKFTYTEYRTWPDEERWELIDGVPYNMTPAPGTQHQKIVGALHLALGNRLAGGRCTAFISPTDVVFSEHDAVQPDVFVVCDKTKITDANVQGAPELIFEVLSPATTLKDRREKKVLYEKHGVTEYVIVDPAGRTVERFFLKSGRFNAPEVFGPEDTLKLHSLEGVEIPLSDIFKEEE